MSESQADRIKLRCQCGVKLAVPASAVGRRVKCPKCEFKMIVPEPKPQAPAPPPISEPDDADPFGDSLLDDLAANEGNAETSQASSGGAGGGTCPNCGVSMSPGAQLCVGCGYNAATGRVQKAAKIKTPSAVGKLAKSASTYLIGCALSLAGAIIGAAVWAGVAIGVGAQLGLVAIGLGFAAGLGMRIGYGKENFRAGLTSVGTTLLGILVAKIAIFGFVVNAVLTGDTGTTEFRAAYVAIQMSEDECQERGTTLFDLPLEERQEITARNARKVDRMGNSELQDRWQHYKDKEKEAVADEEAWVLAYHHAELKANKQGLSLYGLERDELADAEHDRFMAMSSEDRAAALEDMNAWDNGAKWDAPDYARVFLIYHYAGEAIEEASENEEYTDDDDEYEPMAQEEWKGYYDDAVIKVDALVPSEQLAKAKEIDRRQQRELDEAMAEFQQRFGEMESESVDSGAVATGFFKAMFGWMDILFILFAMSTAFKVGGGMDE